MYVIKLGEKINKNSMFTLSEEMFTLSEEMFTLSEEMFTLSEEIQEMWNLAMYFNVNFAINDHYGYPRWVACLYLVEK